MYNNKVLDFIKNVLNNMPYGWLSTTTHRLDIYNESLAKVEFLNQFEKLLDSNTYDTSVLSELPTAYDYIRLGHPLSCILEWAIAQTYQIDAVNVISFDSQTMPIYAVLRKNLLANKHTNIYYSKNLPSSFNAEILSNVYGYKFDLIKIDDIAEITSSQHTNIFISQKNNLYKFTLNPNVDFFVNIHHKIGSVIIVNDSKNKTFASSIQHVRRRETIAMTPANSLLVLKAMIKNSIVEINPKDLTSDRKIVLNTINQITNTNITPLVSSSGLSIQYAILMGLIHDGFENHKGKAIKIIVPPNCYGGTNDQARRVATCFNNVDIIDLPVDGDHNMVESIDLVLSQAAEQDAIPYIIAEIPTNPRVEVPNLDDLKAVLTQKRHTKNGKIAVDPVFILDQTFCPNVQFLGEGNVLSTVRTISFASGSKFPSGGLCTSGYCVGNNKTKALMDKIKLHLQLCDNEATDLQIQILSKQLPSMNKRIKDAYLNTREFVDFIAQTLPTAKINFVSEELAQKGFTPSVFSLDLPTKGNTDKEKEAYKRELNLKLINLMITQIPNESKYCVSYGQLKGCYWTVPATSTQGTTKEGDKDYIARVALSPNMDLERHKKVFLDFVSKILKKQQ